MDDDLIPFGAAPPPPDSTPSGLECALCLYTNKSGDPRVVTIMCGYATCRTHMTHFVRFMSDVLHPSVHVSQLYQE